MAFTGLTEDHKQLAVEVLKGTPKSHIAEKIGVHRATLYEWMKDPLWQRYLQDLSDAQDDARLAALQELNMVAIDMTTKYMKHKIHILDQGDDALIEMHLPSIDQLTQALKRVVDLHTTSTGGPTRIQRTETESPGDSPRGRDIKGLLDRIMTKEESMH